MFLKEGNYQVVSHNYSREINYNCFKNRLELTYDLNSA